MKILIEAIGWCGAWAILAAYALTNFGALAVGSAAYQLLNLFGALGIVIESGAKRDYQPAALNLIWLAVALIALARSLI